MDKFREKYIALQKAFWDSDGGAASVLALYEFKDELEKYAEKEAKLVLACMLRRLLRVFRRRGHEGAAGDGHRKRSF